MINNHFATLQPSNPATFIPLTTMTEDRIANLTYHSTSFSQGRMDFTWEELTDDERTKAYADWDAGKGLIGGNPERRPHPDFWADWMIDRPFFRTLALDNERSRTGSEIRQQLAGDRPLEVEIGFGRGDFILDRARRYPDRIFLAYEVKTKATRLCLQRAEQMALENLWFSDDDARFSFPRMIDDGRIDTVHVLFPDPWWKDQHRVKRLFSPPFVDLLATKIKSGGLLFFKSDVQEYGDLVSHLVGQHDAFLLHDPALAERIGEFAITHREYWCQVKNKPVHSYYFLRG